MPKSKSDISNSALRIFLQRVGKYYDELRGFDEFKPTLKQKQEVLNFFNERCCYCNLKIDVLTMTIDHLIPMNKESLGLHAWGNGVSCCRNCNAQKHFKKWETYLGKICTPIQYARREVKIKAFLAKYKYEPNLKLEIIANNLYQDVGAVAMALIDLRFKQAEDVINRIHQK
jgi:hypothetical protein